ncbi:MAG: NAD-dependent epimerase/dehydratase family protein [Phycisphaerae bacterium]
MQVAVTGATGFLGRYIVRHLDEMGHSSRCWYRAGSDRTGFDTVQNTITWVRGDLSDADSMLQLVSGCDAVVHAALDRPGAGFRGSEGDVATFVERNVLGTVRLIEAALKADVSRFIFIATCAVHEVILDDRALDETHPLWPTTHYGAHKAAIEKFVHSYGLGHRYDICSLRPTGIYGAAHPLAASRWYELVHAVARGQDVVSACGGKEVHAADVARAVGILLTAEGIAGQAYNCYDMYVAEQDVAAIAKRITGSSSNIEPLNKGPKYQIGTGKLRALGMDFGGKALLERTIAELLRH